MQIKRDDPITQTVLVGPIYIVIAITLDVNRAKFLFRAYFIPTIEIYCVLLGFINRLLLLKCC